ncbi:MAG: hypothetical protein ACRDSI_14500 [Pseudonocardiaceae bacterium]
MAVLRNDTGGSQCPAQRLDGPGDLGDQVLQLDLARPHLRLNLRQQHRDGHLGVSRGAWRRIGILGLGE